MNMAYKQKVIADNIKRSNCDSTGGRTAEENGYSSIQHGLWLSMCLRIHILAAHRQKCLSLWILVQN